MEGSRRKGNSRRARRRLLSFGYQRTVQNKIGNDGDRRKLSARFLIKMQIRRATSLIFFRPRLDFLLFVSAVPTLFASIDLSFLQLCRDTGLDRSQALFMLFILLFLSISSCPHLIFTSLHPVCTQTLYSSAIVDIFFGSTFENGEFLFSKNILFLRNQSPVVRYKSRTEKEIELKMSIYFQSQILGIKKNSILTKILSQVRLQMSYRKQKINEQMRYYFYINN